MRHGKKFNHLGRKTAHRKAMLSNMACSLIEHKRISTTVAKAKALRVYVEPLITKSKTDSTHSRRTVFSYLGSKDAVSELFRDIAPKVAGRPGGYTRIIRTGFRLGDNAEMCMIELVDFNELMLNDTTKKSTTRRSRRGGAPKGNASTEESVVEETAVETVEVSEVATEETPKASVEEATEVSTEEAPEDTTSEESSEEEK
jgi:large subunit ribosomal protein L17